LGGERAGGGNIARAAEKGNVRALIYTSSCTALLARGEKCMQLAKEDAFFPAISFDQYARSKAVAERVVFSSKVPVRVALRPGAVFGLDDAMLADPLLRQQTPILGTGDAQMPYVWVEDVARGHVLAVRTVLDGRGAQMDLKAFHLTGDPRGTRYGTFCGDAPRGPDGLTIWGGKRDVPRIPMTLARALAAVNEAWAASFGYAPLDRNLTTAAIIYTQTTYTYDVSGATNGRAGVDVHGSPGGHPPGARGVRLPKGRGGKGHSQDRQAQQQHQGAEREGVGGGFVEGQLAIQC